MLQHLRKIISLNNLIRSNSGGQIATLLILAMVVLLIFILATVNLGQVSIKTTRLANAADSAALLLASQLATKANFLLNALKAQDGEEGAKFKDGPPPALCSKSRGILGTLLAILAIIAMAILCQGCLAAIGHFLLGSALGAKIALLIGVKLTAVMTTVGAMAVGAVAGAIGGAISYEGDIKGILMGAMQGMMIGAAMAGGYYTLQGWFSAGTVAPAAGAELAPGTALSGGEFIASTGEIMSLEGATVVESSLVSNVVVGEGAGATACVEIGGEIAYGTITSAEVSGTLVVSAGVGTAGAVTTATGGLVEGTVVHGAALTTAAAAGGVGAGIAAASKLYTAVVAEQMRAEGFAAAAQALNGMPEYDRIREGVFLQVFSQLVDDPTKVRDNLLDINSNGIIDEEITRFEMWWFWRSQIIKWLSGVIYEVVDDFTATSFLPFLSFVYGLFPDEQDEQGSGDSGGATIAFPLSITPDTTLSGFLNRREIEGEDGALLTCLRPLIWGFSWWKPGPEDEQLLNWIESDGDFIEVITGEDDPDCPLCDENDLPSIIPDLAGYDEVDAAITTLKNFIEQAEKFGFMMDKAGVEMSQSWQSWLPAFYEPDGENDYYHQFGVLLDGRDADENGTYFGPDDYKGIKRWRQEMVVWRILLPVCTYDTTTGLINNAPCKFLLSQYGGSVDPDLADEITPAIRGLNTLIGEIQEFKDACKALYDEINSIYSMPYILANLSDWVSRTFSGEAPPLDFIEMLSQFTSINAFGYRWKDNRGEHQIRVETGPFIVPRTENVKHGNMLKNKQCIELQDYEDPLGGLTWVEVTEVFPEEKEIKPKGAGFSIGSWLAPTESRKITRRASAGYKYIPLPRPKAGNIVILGLTKIK